MFRAAIQILNEHKVLRGMLSYATLWPMGSLIEQTLVEKRNWKTYDWKKCLKYSSCLVCFCFCSVYFYWLIAVIYSCVYRPKHRLFIPAEAEVVCSPMFIQIFSFCFFFLFRCFCRVLIFRFSAYGGLLMGPTMYVWVRIAAHIWPRTSFRSSLSKAFTELCCYDPLSICTFMFVMSLFENKSIEEAEDEVGLLFHVSCRFYLYDIEITFTTRQNLLAHK